MEAPAPGMPLFLFNFQTRVRFTQISRGCMLRSQFRRLRSVAVAKVGEK